MTNKQLFLKAGTTSQLVGQIVELQLEPIGVPPYLLAVLTHIRDLAPVSPTAVAAASGMPPTTLRDNIQRLVERGLAVRVPNPDDGRSYLLAITPRGESVTRSAGPALLDAYLDLERRLPRPLAEYECLLDELNEALHGVLAGEPPEGPDVSPTRVRPA